MTETEAPEVDVDDLLTQAQDAMFDSNIAGAIQLCKEVISKKPRESDAYTLLRSLYIQQKDYKQASEISKAWGVKCGYTGTQLRAQAESAYIIGDNGSVVDAGRRLVNGRFREPVGVFSKIFVAALCAEVKESELTNSLFNSCENEAMEEEDEEVVAIFSAWAEMRSSADRRPYGLQEMEKCLATPDISYRGFATALMAIDHIKEGKLGDAETLLSGTVFPADDANIAGARALLLIAKNGNTANGLDENEEWKRNVQRGLTGGSNILVRRRLVAAVEEGRTNNNNNTVAGR